MFGALQSLGSLGLSESLGASGSASGSQISTGNKGLSGLGTFKIVLLTVSAVAMLYIFKKVK